MCPPHPHAVRLQDIDADGEFHALLGFNVLAFGDTLEDSRQFIAEEDRENGRGRFVGAQAVVV